MSEFVELLTKRPVIAAVRDEASVARAAGSQAPAIFLLGGSILTLPGMARAAKASGKRVFVHLDLLAGLGHDAEAVAWCAREAAPDGVISTRAPLLKAAKTLGLLTIQRLFVMDSSSLQHGVKQLLQSRPDMVEALPGLVPKAITQLKAALPGCGIIAGGMVTESAEVRAAVEAGAYAVSTSIQQLWGLRREDLFEGARP